MEDPYECISDLIASVGEIIVGLSSIESEDSKIVGNKGKLKLSNYEL